MKNEICCCYLIENWISKFAFHVCSDCIKRARLLECIPTSKKLAHRLRLDKMRLPIAGFEIRRKS